MHLDAELIERLVHGELKGEGERAAREHIAECETCRERVAVADREVAAVHALLREVDHDPPQLNGTRVARAQAHRFRWGRLAAGMLLTVGTAGVLYAAPGSPLPGWLAAAVEWMLGRVEHPPVPGPTAPVGRPSMAGIAVAPGESLVISFAKAQVDGQAIVSMTDGPDVVVRAPTGAATFTTHVALLLINNLGPPATFEIQIPRTAPRVEIVVDGARIFLKEGHQLTTGDSAAQAAPYLLQLEP